MTIVNVITLLKPFGGAQAVALDHIRYQLKENHKSILITSNKNSSFIDFIDHKNFDLIILKPLNSSNPLKLIYAFVWMLWYVIKTKPDFIVSHSTIAGFFSRFIGKITQTKSIHTYHGFNTAFKKVFGKLYLFTEKFVKNFNDMTINVCYTDYEFAKKNKIISGSKAFVIYNSTNFKITNNPIPVSDKCNLKFVMVARHCSQKDHETLFKALKKIKNNNFTVDLIGGGELFENNKKIAEELDVLKKVKFLGEVDNVSDRLIDYDCAILISNMEGFSISILESLASGLPIIATDVGGVKEQVIDNYNGFLVPHDNDSYLAEKMIYILNNKKILKDFSQNSVELVLKKFSISSFNMKIHKLYKMKT